MKYDKEWEKKAGEKIKEDFYKKYGVNYDDMEGIFELLLQKMNEETE